MLTSISQVLARLSQRQILTLAFAGVAAVGFVDYVTGFDFSVSLFYLGPVAAAAWYCGRGAAVGIAVLSSIAWFAADFGAGHVYEHPAISVWNALVRLGIYLITGLLLTTLRGYLSVEERLARTDSLTGVLNRRALFERLEYVLQLARRQQSTLTLVYVDLDDFKTINDTRGHAEGDRVLRTVADVLAQNIRQADTAARLGGDEFALLLVDTDRQGAEELISKQRQRLRETLASAGFDATCSIGVVTFHQPPATADDALRAADGLMYKVKAGGKNGTAFEESGVPPPHTARLKTG
jgi:diguanylate cyclase (GGDEF)-like protein